jgi:hypothetical protein
MGLNTKRTKKENRRNKLTKLKIISKISRKKMRLRSALLLIVPNISIQNVSKSMIQKNYLNILIQILFILGAHYIIVMHVVLVEIQCQFFNVLDAQKLFIQDAWINKK